MASSSEIEIEVENQPSPATPHASSASSSVAADPTSSSYDVFINHRGPDTKKTFASHLYHRLLSHGFRPFLDQEELQEGIDFPSQIEHAIRSASVQVAVFSPKYAESEWCLRELLIMLESKAPIIPVFYHVQPADVRWTGEDKTGVYAEALRRLQLKKTHCSQTHQDKPRYDPATIQKWRDTLSRVADISGFDLDGKFNGVCRFLRYKSHVSAYSKHLVHALYIFKYKILFSKTLVSVKEEPSETVSSGTNFTKGHHAIVVAAQSAGHGQIDHSVRPLQIVEPANESSDILAPSGNREFWKSWSTDIPTSSAKDEELAEDIIPVSSSYLHSNATSHQWALGAIAELLDNAVDECEGQMIDKLVEGVVKMVKKTRPLYVAQYPTGLDGKVKDFETTVLSTHQRTGNVQMVGIVGFGGVGKTTLAKEFFNRKRSEYNKSCFLSDVRENAKNSLHSLQRKLLKDLNLLNGCLIDDIHEGTEMLRKSLSSSQVFLILDDIDHQDQVVALLPDRDGLHSDSLILITSRDKGVLARSGVEELSIYELKGLDTTHSQEFFCSYAFCQPYPLRGFEDLVNMFLRTCDGLPLSLKVFGALLFGEKDKSHWKDILDRVHEVPNEILDRLRISYDALTGEERQIFLDIACFFIGKDKTTAITLWDGSGWKGSLGFRNLQGKCLVEVDHENIIHMHDHLRDLGRDIAKEEWPRRLWRPTENIDDWLHQQSYVISQARGISMQCSHEVTNVLIRSPMFSWFQRKIDKISGNLMKKPTRISATKLQLLSSEGHLLERILRKVNSPNLIWLSWRDCPYSYLPSWIPMKNLRVLRVQGRLLETLWQGQSQAPLQLQELEISDAVHLSNIPKSMGQLKHLEWIIISPSSRGNGKYCPMESLPDSFGNLGSLQHMNLSGCKKLERLPDSFGNLASLQHMDLTSCGKLERLPDSFGNLASLEHMNLSSCGKLERLPDSFGNLASLQHMNLSSCGKLERLPDSFGNLASLQHMKLSECSGLERLPDSFGNLASLQHMELSWCVKLERLPDSFGNLASLQHIYLYGCSSLERLPDSFGNLASLQQMDLSCCEKLERLPDSFGNLASLQHMDLSRCEKLERLPDSFGNLASLQHMKLSGCFKLERLPDSFGNLASLQHMDLSGCKKLERLPDSFGNLASLQHMDLSGCKKLERLPDSFGNLASLQHMNLSGCEKLERLPDSFGNLANLQHMDLSYCKNIERLPGSFGCLSSLKSFKASGCSNLTISSDTLGNIRRLEHIDLSGCGKIEVWPSQLALQRSLKTLELTGTNFKELLRAVEVPRGLEVLRIGSPLVDTLSLGDLRKLKELTLKDGRELKHLPASVGLSTKLISLEVVGCPAMELPFKMVKGQRGTLMKSDSSINHNYMFRLDELKLRKDTEISEVSFDEGVCPNLRDFILEGCSNLAEVGTLPSTLTRVHLENCCNLRKIGGLCGLASLRILYIKNCEELEELPTIGMKSLECLYVSYCVKLKSIRDLAQLTKPLDLNVYGCDELEELEGVEYCKSPTVCPKLQVIYRDVSQVAIGQGSS